MYALQCNHSNTTAKAGFVNVVGGTLGVAAGCGTNEVVAGTRAEICAARNIVSSGAMAEKVRGPRAMQTGPSTFETPAAMTTSVKGGGKISAATTSLQAGANVVFVADSITLEVASLNIEAGATYTLAGSHSVSGGKVSVDAPTTQYQGKATAQS